MEDEALFEKLSMLFDSQQYDRAYRMAVEALADDPTSGHLHAVAGGAAVWGQIDLEKGEVHLKASLQEMPENPSVIFGLSKLEALRRNYKLSAEHALKALKIDPDEPIGWMLLAWARLHCGNFGEAVDAAENAVRLSSDNFYAHDALIMARLFGKRISSSEALDRFRELVPDHPEHSQLNHRIGVLSGTTSEEDSDECIERFTEALRLDPDSRLYKNNLIGGIFAKAAKRSGYIVVLLFPSSVFEIWLMGGQYLKILMTAGALVVWGHLGMPAKPFLPLIAVLLLVFLLESAKFIVRYVIWRLLRSNKMREPHWLLTLLIAVLVVLGYAGVAVCLHYVPLVPHLALIVSCLFVYAVVWSAIRTKKNGTLFVTPEVGRRK